MKNRHLPFFFSILLLLLGILFFSFLIGKLDNFYVSAQFGSIDLDSFRIFNDCRLSYMNNMNDRFYIYIPSDYKSNQVKVWGSSNAFDTEINVCGGANECLIQVSPGKKLEFTVKYSGKSDMDELDAFAVSHGDCRTRIGVARAAQGASKPTAQPETGRPLDETPEPTEAPTSRPSALPTTRPLPTTKPSPTPTLTKGGCRGDSDCRRFTCNVCEVEQRICIKQRCLDCASDSHCKSGYECVSNSCLEKRREEAEYFQFEERLEPVCGDSSCDSDLGEDCLNCFDDCQWEGFCCQPERAFMYPHDFRYQIFQINQNPGGLIPNGTFLVNPDEKESGFFDRYRPMLCENHVLKFGDCVRSSQCPSGICLDYQCEKIGTSKKDKLEEIDKDVAKKWVDDTSERKRYYVHAYHVSEDNFVIHDQNEGLDIKLDVQGTTGGEVLGATVGDEITSLMTIKNYSDYRIALIPAIHYPGSENKVDEVSYHTTYTWVGILNSFKGKFLTKISGSQYYILPPGGKMYVESKVISEKDGYLDIEGLVYFSTGKKFIEGNLGLGLIKNKRVAGEFEKKHQTAKFNQTVLVEEPTCYLGVICL